METISLARKALENIPDVELPVQVSMSGGGCDSGWDTPEVYLELYGEEALGLVKQAIENDWSLKDLVDVEALFKGIEIADVDVAEKLNDIAYEAAWPDGGPSGRVEEYLPIELNSLANEIQALDQDEAEVTSIRKKLCDIQSGDFTIVADILYAGDYMLSEGEKITIQLSAKQARGILYHYCDNDRISIESLFEGIDYEETDEGDIQDIIDKKDFGDYLPEATGECEALENYTNACCQFIYAIYTDKITEDNFDDCLSFFDEADYEYEPDFDTWFEENIEDA